MQNNSDKLTQKNAFSLVTKLPRCQQMKLQISEYAHWWPLRFQRHGAPRSRSDHTPALSSRWASFDAQEQVLLNCAHLALEGRSLSAEMPLTTVPTGEHGPRPPRSAYHLHQQSSPQGLP